MVVTWNSLTADPSGRAVLKLTSDTYFKAESLGVAVRSSSWANLDYPGKVAGVNVGPEGYTYVSDIRTALSPGTYKVYGCYKLGGVWTNGPIQNLVVPESGGSGKVVVFDAPFTDTTKWNVGKSSAYPNTGPTNINDSKLDYISPLYGPSASGVFTADRRNSTQWNTDLVTTEYVSGGGFELLPNDEITATITLGSERGAWPAIWTWGRDNPPGYSGVQPGHGEVDLFEYHTDNPNLLELSNHVSGTNRYVNNVVSPGVPFNLRVVFGTTSVDWYVNDVLVFADGAGVPSYWRAWPIVNLSVSSGTWHPAPLSTQTHMEYSVTNFKVWR